MAGRDERERAARRARLNVLSLTLYELSGKMTQSIRHAREAGLEPVSNEIAFMQRTVDRWRDKIKARQAQWA